MTRRRYRYDRDLDALVEIGDNYFEEGPKGPYVIGDIEGYRAMGADVACDGKRPWIGGRRQHREYLQRNKYIEVGNDPSPHPSDAPSPREAQRQRVEAIKRAMGEYGSNTRD